MPRIFEVDVVSTKHRFIQVAAGDEDEARRKVKDRIQNGGLGSRESFIGKTRSTETVQQIAGSFEVGSNSDELF